ncbi:MAG: TIGR03663 family protein [Dehalococcoidia bacterium]|nr:TIGR03663 family protein [Dehalococcoidia bacterium]
MSTTTAILAAPSAREPEAPARPWWRDPVVLMVIAAAAAALVLRIVDLDVRAMHHDESLHAQFSWYFAEGRGYEHNPLMHGPLQFHLIAGFFVLFGDGDVMARLPAALFGTALVATPLLFRRSLGETGVVVAAVLLALSPALLYYSRFARNDLLMAVFAVVLVAGIWRYRQDGRLRWLLAISAALALSFSSKETAYLTAGVFLMYVAGVLAAALLAQWRVAHPEVPRSLRWLLGAALLAGGWLIAALWPLLGALRARLGLHERPREADLMVVIGTLVATQLAAFVQVPLTALGADVSGDTERQVGILTVASLLLGSAAVGVLWDPRRWLLVAALFLAIEVPLYATFFTHPEGIAGAFWTSLDYWIAQHDVQRGAQPWYYYLMLLPIYELWLLVPVLAGGVWLLLRRDGFALLLGWWFLGTLVGLSVAGEKMPWLVTHLALPLAFFAAYVLGLILPAVATELRAWRSSAGPWIASGAGLVLAALLLVFTLRTGFGVSFRHPDTPVEPLIYTQTSPDVPVLARQVRDAIESGTASAVLVDQTASLTWPWAWYLRDMPVSYANADFVRTGDVQAGTIVIAEGSTVPAQHDLRDGATVVEFRHRWWFPETGYKDLTWRRFADGLASGSLLEDWLTFAVRRVDESALGTLNGEVLFPPEGVPPSASSRSARWRSRDSMRQT